jgi:hypothetical protein
MKTETMTNLERELTQALLYLTLDTNALMFGEGNADGKCVHTSMREAIMLLKRVGQDVSGLKVEDYED